MSNFRSNQSDSSSSYSSSSCYLATRTLKNNKYGKMMMMMGGRRRLVMHHPPAWTMTSLLTALPESPSPICTHAAADSSTHKRHPHTRSHASTYSDNATEFSTPRNQRFGIACNDNYNNNCFSDIDEWLEHANKFCKSFNHHHTDDHLTETAAHSRRNGSPEDDLRISAVVCNNFLTAPESELYNIVLPSIREESPAHHAQTHLTSCINRYGGGAYKSRSNERTRLMSRPKPYDEFFNEVTRKKLEADRDARNKAKHVELMHRLRRKEDAINDWEMQQTRKAMDHMDKIQNELERKQLMASARAQKKICLVREKAEKQKLNLRRSTMKKFQQLQTSSETHSPSDTSWDSRLPLC